MTTDVKELTKNWIKYLKNNRIVDMQSDPGTGDLKYKRKVTVDDVTEFLELKTDFDNQVISNAVRMVLSKQAMGGAPSKLQNNPSPAKPGTGLSTWHHIETTPGKKANNQDTQQAVDIGPTRIRHDKDSVSDIDYREVPDDPKSRSKFKRRNFKEAIKDEAGHNLSEEQIEQLFNILVGSQSSPEQEPEQQEPEPEQEESEQVDPQERIRNLNRLKLLIRDRMSDSQRKALWRALTDA